MVILTLHHNRKNYRDYIGESLEDKYSDMEIYNSYIKDNEKDLIAETGIPAEDLYTYTVWYNKEVDFSNVRLCYDKYSINVYLFFNGNNITDYSVEFIPDSVPDEEEEDDDL